MTMMQVSQSEMVQQLARLQSSFNMVVKELAETRNKQQKQQQMLESMMKFLTTKQGISYVYDKICVTYLIG